MRLDSKLFLYPLAVGTIHFAICVALRFGVVASEGSWSWFVLFLLDLPISIPLIMIPVPEPLFTFGVFGTGWWVWLTHYFVKHNSLPATPDIRSADP